MAGPDFERHNAEVREVWAAYHAGDPARVPMTLGVNPRYVLLDPALNLEGITFEGYFSDPDVMFETQLRFQHWVRHNLEFDQEMGLPECWSVSVDFQNSHEALWFGAPLRYFEGNVPDTVPFITDDTKQAFLDAGPPDPFSGWMARNWEYFEHMEARAEGYEFRGRPVSVSGLAGCGTDGPFTLGCSLRGATELCTDIYADPGFFHAFMGRITDATIDRIKAFRRRLGQPVVSDEWGFADDSIQLLSVETYRQHVLPYHRRLVETFGRRGPNSIHLCGDATHHFPMIRDELNVMAFDTGYPVDHGKLRGMLGRKVTIHGGPAVELLRAGSAETVAAETRRILESGVMRGGRFILREGNNLAPGTPPANVKAMYEACKRYGRYGQ